VPATAFGHSHRPAGPPAGPGPKGPQARGGDLRPIFSWSATAASVPWPGCCSARWASGSPGVHRVRSSNRAPAAL